MRLLLPEHHKWVESLANTHGRQSACWEKSTVSLSQVKSGIRTHIPYTRQNSTLSSFPFSFLNDTLLFRPSFLFPYCYFFSFKKMMKSNERVIYSHHEIKITPLSSHIVDFLTSLERDFEQIIANDLA